MIHGAFRVNPRNPAGEKENIFFSTSNVRKTPQKGSLASMKTKIGLLLCLTLTFCIPKHQVSQQNWFKGNLHTHSYWSDGDDYPEMVMDWYKSNGYDFVSLSEHNVIAEGEKWKLIPKSRVHEEAFQKYLEKYGEEWVNFKEDTGRISVKLKTLNEYRRLFDVSGEFLILQAEEITDRFDGKPLHLNANNLQELIPPQGGNSVTEVLQNNINTVIEQRARLGVPIMVHVNHPNFGYAITVEDLIPVRGERFFEVYNGHAAVNNRGDSAHISTEQMWDLINSARIKSGDALLFGLATDDAHNYHLFGSSYSNAGRGWVMVNCDELTPETLINAMEAGQFYSTTGVILKKLTFEDNLLSIAIRPESDVTYEFEFIGQFAGESPKILHRQSATEVQYQLTEDVEYVRARITSSKLMENPVYEKEQEMAWTQPVRFTSSN